MQSGKRNRSKTRRTKESNKKIKIINTTLPAEGFVRQPTVLAIFDTSRSTLWRWITEGRFPKGYKLGPGTTAWSAEELRQHMRKIQGAE